IAVQGDVIDGRAELGFDNDGTAITTITPKDGSPKIVVQIDGTPTISTGFAKELVPGAPRDTSPRKALVAIDHQLAQLESDPKLGAQAKHARSELAQLDGTSETDGAKALAAMPPDLQAALKSRAADAFKTLVAHGEWAGLRAGDRDHVFLGD